MGRKGRPKKYQTEEERKAAHREALRRYRQKHKEERAEYQRQYRVKHPDHQKQYYKTPTGRALGLLQGYRSSDKIAGRGECTLTAQWITDNIFTKPCHWCGETGWEIMGCDRINNELPHTPDNVIPCCWECNHKRGTKTYEEYLETLRADEMTL